MGVQRVEVIESIPYAGGRRFGDVGPYVLDTLRLWHRVDPAAAENACITDLGLASNDDDGLVGFDHDLQVVRPASPDSGNRRTVVDLVNRGRPTLPGYLHLDDTPPFPVPPEPPVGDGWLLEEGWTVLHLGWQSDVAARSLLGLRAPEVLVDGAPVVGTVHFSAMPPNSGSTLTLELPGHRAYEAIPDGPARLTESVGGLDPAVEIDRSRWEFSPDGRSLVMESGFVAGNHYELEYTARGATVVGVGLLAIRDTALWWRSQAASDLTVVFGVSQCGRLIRHYLAEGLNRLAPDDAPADLVYDAAMPLIAGGRVGSFNRRFARPGLLPRDDEGLVDAARYRDLDQTAAEPAHRPMVTAINTSTEYWRGDAASVHEDPGRPDPSTRLLHVAGSQHSPGVVPQLFEDPYFGLRGANGFNTVDYRPIVRAAFAELVERTEAGRAAAPDIVPAGDEMTSRDDVLGRFAAAGWPVPVAVSFGQPDGPVPDVGADLNERAGVRLPDLVQPLGVHTGWNLRHRDNGGSRHQLLLRGSTRWFPSTELPAADVEGYLALVRPIVERLVADGLVLERDVDLMLRAAGARFAAADGTVTPASPD